MNVSTVYASGFLCCIILLFRLATLSLDKSAMVSYTILHHGTIERSLFSSPMAPVIDEKPDVLPSTELNTLDQISSEFPTMELDSDGIDALNDTIVALADLTKGFNTSEIRQWSMTNGTYYGGISNEKHLAFIIPFRDESPTQFRTHQLYLMLHYTMRYLIKQESNFTMLIVNQESGKPFNRAKLLNIGFEYASKETQANCFVFHDVDLIAEGDDFVYYCDAKRPLHLSAWRNNQNYTPRYQKIMG